MKPTVRQISAFFEEWAPKSTKLDYDNVGLMVGDAQQEVDRILTCLDCTEDVVEEAKRKNISLIVSHHPLIFQKLSSITNKTPEGRIIRQLIANDISLLSVHTNLDAARDGVSVLLAEILGLSDIALLHKTTSFLQVRFKTKLDTSAFNDVPGCVWMDKTGDTITSVIPGTSKKAIIGTLKSEDADFEWISDSEVQSSNAIHGFGAVGSYPQPMSQDEFLSRVCTELDTPSLHFSGSAEKISKVAVCGGSGSKLIPLALASGAQAFVTADITYHSFFIDKPEFLLVDTGHYENEFPIVAEMARRLSDTFPELDVFSTEVNTNPVKLFIHKNNQ